MAKPRTSRRKLLLPFARRLRLLRRDKGMSRYRLAKAARMDLSHLRRIEQGEIGPGLDTIKRLARALGCPMEYLVQECPSKPNGSI